MHLYGASLAVAGHTLLAQIVAEPTWLSKISEILHALMTLAILVLAVAVVPAAWNFRKSYQKISDLLDRVYADINPLAHHASRIAENVDYVTTALRADVQRASATLSDADRRLQEAIRRAESRARDFDALLAVVQDETEGAFVNTASTMRGVRSGMQTLRDTLQATLREAGDAATAPKPRPSVGVRADLAAIDASVDDLADDPMLRGDAIEELDELEDELDDVIVDELEDDYADDFDEEEGDGRSNDDGTPQAERPRVRPKRGSHG